MSDQPTHPNTRRVKPVCAVCHGLFHSSDGIILRERSGDGNLYYHSACAGDIERALSKPVYIHEAAGLAT